MSCPRPVTDIARLTVLCSCRPYRCHWLQPYYLMLDSLTKNRPQWDGYGSHASAGVRFLVGSATSRTSRRNVRDSKPCAGCVSHLPSALTYMNHLHVHQSFTFQLNMHSLSSLMFSVSLVSVCFSITLFHFRHLFLFSVIFVSLLFSLYFYFAIPRLLLSFCFILVNFDLTLYSQVFTSLFYILSVLALFVYFYFLVFLPFPQCQTR
jgi:hypothetical protein